MNVPPLKKADADIVACVGTCRKYVVDSEGNVYSKLKTQGTRKNPRYHLWIDSAILKVYKTDLTQAANAIR